MCEKLDIILPTLKKFINGENILLQEQFHMLKLFKKQNYLKLEIIKKLRNTLMVVNNNNDDDDDDDGNDDDEKHHHQNKLQLQHKFQMNLMDVLKEFEYNQALMKNFKMDIYEKKMYEYSNEIHLLLQIVNDICGDIVNDDDN